MIAYGLGALTQSEAIAYVASLYQDILNRNQGPTEGQTWITDLTSGALTESQVANDFLNSAEYKGSAADQAHWAALSVPFTGANVTTQSAPSSTVVSPILPTTANVTTQNASNPTVVSPSLPSVNQPVVATTNATQPVVGSTDLFPGLAFDGFSGTEVALGGAAILLLVFMTMRKH